VCLQIYAAKIVIFDYKIVSIFSKKPARDTVSKTNLPRYGLNTPGVYFNARGCNTAAFICSLLYKHKRKTQQAKKKNKASRTNSTLAPTNSEQAKKKNKDTAH